MSGHATVSVVIPIKNRAQLFAETVLSLAKQTYPHWEAIVVDDGSSPAEFSRITALAATDPRIRLLKNRGRTGACGCRNTGLAASCGEFVIFMDSDDTLSATCLSGRITVMGQNPSADFAAFPMMIFNLEPGDCPYLWNKFLPDDDLDRFLRADSPWNTAGPIWRRASLTRAGLSWDERARSWQDWDFHVRALTSGLHYVKIPEADAFWRSATRLGSIGSVAATPRSVFSRVRLLRKIARCLRDRNALTPRRRRSLATNFFRHAFQSGLSRKRMLLIWQTGRRAGIVGCFEFIAGIFAEALIRTAAQVGRRIEYMLFPELCVRAHYGLHRETGHGTAMLRTPAPDRRPCAR